jgi:NAD dependent epimerase/dehydratase family enzyme
LFSQRVSPTAAEAAGYPFRYTTLEAAFADLLRP